jgi:hypothetical protein
VDTYPAFSAGFCPRSRPRPGESPQVSHRSRDEGPAGYITGQNALYASVPDLSVFTVPQVPMLPRAVLRPGGRAREPSRGDSGHPAGRRGRRDVRHHPGPGRCRNRDTFTSSRPGQAGPGRRRAPGIGRNRTNRAFLLTDARGHGTPQTEVIPARLLSGKFGPRGWEAAGMQSHETTLFPEDAGQSRIAASPGRWRDWLTFTVTDHSYFPWVYVHDRGRCYSCGTCSA